MFVDGESVSYSIHCFDDYFYHWMRSTYHRNQNQNHHHCLVVDLYQRHSEKVFLSKMNVILKREKRTIIWN